MFLNIISNGPLVFILYSIGLVSAITIHEFAHAWSADQLGDPTPRAQGRVTLNPLAHLDPYGTLALLLVGFGWGRPVEFDPYNFRHRTRDSALVAFAGPASNLVLALLSALVVQTLGTDSALVAQVFSLFTVINVGLAIFNLVPVAPLDGEKILFALLPRQTAYEYRQFMNQYGFFVLLFLIFPIINGQSAISSLIAPIIQTIVGILLI